TWQGNWPVAAVRFSASRETANSYATHPLRARHLLTSPCPTFRFQPPGEGVMKVKPIGDRIVVRRQEASEKTAGGIVLPDSAKNKSQRGKVLAVGPGKMLKDGSRRGLQVKEGDTILFTAWAGDEYKEGRGDNILIMRE